MMIELPDVDRRGVRVRLLEKADAWERVAPGVTVVDGLPVSAAIGNDVMDAVLVDACRVAVRPFKVAELLYALARLIDRPTCRNVAPDMSHCHAPQGFECSECGFSYPMTGFKHCPDCGAEVVGND